MGRIVHRVVASDLDSDSRLEYKLMRTEVEGRTEEGRLVVGSQISTLFDIDKLDGSVRLTGSLDREKVETLRLPIQVEDKNAQTPNQVASGIKHYINTKSNKGEGFW